MKKAHTAPRRFRQRRLLPMLLLCAIASALRAGESLPLQPLDPPVAVARLGNPDVLAQILDTRQGRQLPAIGNRPLTLPGSGITIPSLDTLLDRLAERDARALWFCLSQQGGSLASLTSALGWREPSGDGGDGFDKGMLSALGLTTGKEKLDIHFPGDREVMLSRDEKARRLFVDGRGKNDSWRGSLGQFLLRENAGVWMNPRPLLGIASMYSGVDIRSRLLVLGLGVPESIQLEVFPNGEDAGFFIQTSGLVAEEWLVDSGPKRIARFREDAPIQVVVNPPEMLRSRISSRPDIAAILMAINVNLPALFPHSVSLAAWRGGDGGSAWAAVCVMDDRKGLSKTLRRIRSLLRNLDRANPEIFHLVEKRTAWGEPVLEIDYDGKRVVLTIGEAGGEAVLYLADREENLPDPARVVMESMERSPWLAWYVRPDSGMRSGILASLLAFARKEGISLPDGKTLMQLFPKEETGSMGMAEGGVRVESRNSMLPFLLPSLHKVFLAVTAAFQ